MVPYFSTIEAPIELIVFVLGGALCGCVSALYPIWLGKDKWWQISISFIAGFSLYICGVWLLVGDSTSWSKPIGDWLVGR